MNPSNPKGPYYPALDGLRGVAILLVVFLHNFRFMNYFFFGWLGVDLFFVLSGFLITDILLRSVDQPNFLRNFYMRRVLRILPLYYLIVVICLFIIPQIRSLDVDMSYYISHQVWLWSYLQNWLFIFHERTGTNLLLHTWSLAVEEQFYLIWPLVVLLVRKPKFLLTVAFALLILVGLARFAIWIYKVEDLAYASLYTFTRIDGLCIGSMLALMVRVNPGFLKKYMIWIVLLMAGINFGFYFFNTRHGFTLPYLAFVGYTTFAVLFGILVYEAAFGKSKIIHFLFDNRLLKFFGRISYGLYVYHWPVYILLFPLFSDLFTNQNGMGTRGADICSAITVTVISVLISVLSYRYFERFFLRLKKHYT